MCKEEKVLSRSDEQSKLASHDLTVGKERGCRNSKKSERSGGISLC